MHAGFDGWKDSEHAYTCIGKCIPMPFSIYSVLVKKLFCADLGLKVHHEDKSKAPLISLFPMILKKATNNI